MDIKDFAHVVATKISFNEAVVSVIKAVEQKGWALFQVYDITERLAAKGFKHNPLKIIEICSAKYASRFLNKNKLISLCMPCKIIVFEQDKMVFIASMKPSIMAQFFTEISKDEAEEVGKEIIEIINAAIVS